jgi:hypothetical protein
MCITTQSTWTDNDVEELFQSCHVNQICFGTRRAGARWVGLIWKSHSMPPDDVGPSVFFFDILGGTQV